jgi:DNA-binding transcriptional regulator LsrR (DeoR family)
MGARVSRNRNLDAPTSAGNRSLESERGLTAAVARAYYIEDRSRVEIADTFGISRFKVSRLLTRAREEGIITFQINDWGLPDPALGQRLKDVLGLQDCRVVRSSGNDDTVRQQVGAAAASLLSATLKTDEVLGVAWGRTLTATTSRIDHLPRLSIVQLTGFIAGDIGSSPIEVARQASRQSGGEVYPIFAPLFVQDRETAEGLRNHHDIRSAMKLFPAITTALLSVGAWNPPDTQIRDVLLPDDRGKAIASGCVADIAGILIKDDGKPAYPELQERSINITYEQLRNVPRVIAVAGGAAKAEAISAVIRGGLITELVTDHGLALALLGETDD